MHEAPEHWHRRFRHYVLLRSQETPCPSDVTASLQTDRVKVTEVHNPLAALEELCTLNRAEEPRRKHKLPQRPSIALVVIEPGSLEQLPHLYRVIRAHLSDVELFVVETTDEGCVLLDITHPRPAPRRAEPKPMEPDTGTRYGHLRFTGDTHPEVDAPPGIESPAPPEKPAESEPDEKESSSTVNPDQREERTLTAEELDMLLGRNDDDVTTDEVQE